MTVKVQWDTDAEKTGLPDTGSDTKVYTAGQEGEHRVVVTSETDPTRTQTVTFTIPLGGGGDPAITADKTEVDGTGDQAARTVSVTGTGFPASQTGTVTLHPGAPGSGGEALVTANVTVDAQGAIPATAVVVPQNQAAGQYHLVATVGATVVDNTALTVSGGGTGGTLTLDKTTVDAAGDEAARTVSVTGAGLPPSEPGRVAIMTGAVGSGGTEVVGADATADAQGNLAATPLIVPQDQAAGDYHVVGTFGETTIDDNALTVTNGGTGAAITADKTSVNAGGDAAARTVLVSGTGFTPGAGRVAINTGAPSSGGTEVVGADVTADAQGAFPATSLEVPSGTAAGPHHILTSGAMGVVDNTALEVTAATEQNVLTPDKTTVSLAGDAAARTVNVSGSSFTANATVQLDIMTGAVGTGATTSVVGVPTGADGSGNFNAIALEVPTTATAGEHHITGTEGGTVVSDHVALTVTA